MGWDHHSSHTPHLQTAGILISAVRKLRFFTERVGYPKTSSSPSRISCTRTTASPSCSKSKWRRSARCEVLQVELEKEMRAERDALQTALSELYVDTIVETEIKELQIRCALEEYDLKIKAVTAQEETKRKADQKKKK